MKISEHTISALGSIITGDGKFKLSPYRTGSELVIFFNRFGTEDSYGSGFPSRCDYAKEKLREFNDTPTMKDVIVKAFDPPHFVGTQFDIVAAVKQLNQFLEFDGYELKPVGKKWDVYKLGSSDFLLSIAGLGTSAENDLSERDEEILRNEVDPVGGWSLKPDNLASQLY